MSARDWSDLERRLDEAIDALNNEREPDMYGDDEPLLLDSLRTVRRLREPAEPDVEFEDRLVERTLARATPSSLVSYRNGSGPSHPPAADTVAGSSSRRYRLLMSQVAAVLRLIGVFVLAGMLSGALVGGVGGRVAMRVSGYLYQRENPGVSIVTESSGEPIGQISLLGTLDLILQTMGAGTLIGILLLLVGPWLPRFGWQRAIAFGLLLLAVIGSLVIDTDSGDLHTLGPPLLNIAMFATLIVAAGMLATRFVSGLDRAVAATNRRSTRLGARVLGAVAIALGGITLVFASLMLVVNGVTVPIVAVTEPGIDTIVVAPLVLLLLIGIPLTRLAVATPDHLPVLDRLRTTAVSRLVRIVLMLATVAGLLVLLTNTIRIAAG